MMCHKFTLEKIPLKNLNTKFSLAEPYYNNVKCPCVLRSSHGMKIHVSKLFYPQLLVRYLLYDNYRRNEIIISKIRA